MSNKNEIAVQDKLRALLGHDQIEVHSSGTHLLLQLIEEDTSETVARLTKIGPNLYGAAFRTDKGRWEPLPVEGDLLEVAEIVVDMLRPYFDINKF
jgi:hypothetical protein